MRDAEKFQHDRDIVEVLIFDYGLYRRAVARSSKFLNG
jgi:hypothetical protein